MVLFSVVFDCVFVCLSVNTNTPYMITPELSEISSQNFWACPMVKGRKSLTSLVQLFLASTVFYGHFHEPVLITSHAARDEGGTIVFSSVCLLTPRLLGVYYFLSLTLSVCLSVCL